MGTLKNRVRTLRTKENLVRGYSTTKPSSIQLLIPIRKSHTWFGLPAGYTQTDTVVHCGDLLSGDVIYSLGIVDFATYWSEYTTQWNKGQEATRASLERIVPHFPFPLIELHPDTGNEFINNHVYGWTKDVGIARKHLGYLRLDQSTLVAKTSAIPETACLIHNHFRPVRWMITKVRVGAKWHRTFEKVARTPYQRVLEQIAVSLEDKTKLAATYTTLDPLSLQIKLTTLKRELEKTLLKK